MASKTRVLIVDDHPFIREGIRFYLEEAGNFEVVSEAGDGQEAVDKAVKFHPDVVLMDVRLPILDGFEATRRLRALVPSVQVLVLSTSTSGDLTARARQAGALGWVSKDSPPDQVIRALRQVSHGEPAEDPVRG